MGISGSLVEKNVQKGKPNGMMEKIIV